MNNTFEKVYNDFWSVGIKSLYQFSEHRTISNDYTNEEEVTLQNTRPTKRLNDQDRQDQLQKAFTNWYMKGRLKEATEAMEEYGEDSEEYIEYKKRFVGYVKKVASNYLQRYNKYSRENPINDKLIKGELGKSYVMVEFEADLEKSLSDSELNIAKAKMSGYTDREIASNLQTSAMTVNRQMKSIRSKLS